MEQVNNYIINIGKVSQIDQANSLTSTAAIHEAIEIKCFYEGTATLLIESQTISVKAGDVVVINPYEFHATVDTGEVKGKYHMFMLPLDYFYGIPELDLNAFFFAEEKRFCNYFPDDAEMHTFLMQAAQEVEQNRTASNLMTKSLLMCFFTLLLRRGISDFEPPTQAKRNLQLYSVIAPALKCIKNRYYERLTVDELAALCKVSKHYFCRVFKTVTQKSAMEYLRDFRLQTADVLLSCTDKSISEVSECCGFESPNYFSRCYKQLFGKSPSRNRFLKDSAV